MKTAQGLSRRTFIATTAAAAIELNLSARMLAEAGTPQPAGSARPIPGTHPWFRRTFRWAQTNITEEDPATYDVEWWRGHWKRTRVQGVIINAGGIVAYYPSEVPLHYRAEKLGDRDLYGELVKAAHADGLAVLARMDSNRAHEDVYRAHPDWFARDASGNPYRTGGLYVTCINGPYYDQWIPSVLREIVERAHPEGVTDNSWSGLNRAAICFCANCVRLFREATGKSIPPRKDWDDPAYRAWIEWNYARRLAVWDLNNAVTRAAGGPDCLWVGMNSGSISGQCQSFRPYKEICERAEIIMLDHQARGDAGFYQNGEVGKLIHGLLGWEKLIPESMAMYQAGKPTFRKAAKPEPEARLWVVEGIAGTIQPWWHHVGARQEDKRQFDTIAPLNLWHQAHEQSLVNRTPIATVGVVWSQQNTDYFGRDHPNELVELPFRGFTEALMRARIPYLPVHADHIARDASGLRVLVLPNYAAMSDAQIASVKKFVQNGGGLVATGESSVCNEWGDPRPDFALGELFGTHLPAGRKPLDEAARVERASATLHTYLRLPESVKERHPVLRGFEATNILAYGGVLEELTIASDAVTALTFVPDFPVYPPETSWMRDPKTALPGLVIRDPSGKAGRTVFIPADLDRRFARDHLPDHAALLANCVRWASKEEMPLAVSGPGLIDCHLYRQSDAVILHLVNLTGTGGAQPIDELIPVGPFQVRVRLPAGFNPRRVQFLVNERAFPATVRSGWVEFNVATVADHEVAVIRS
ncbi:MAG: alpha-amylase family protein [Verrucomicrobiia bacterium]